MKKRKIGFALIGVLLVLAGLAQGQALPLRTMITGELRDTAFGPLRVVAQVKGEFSSGNLALQVDTEVSAGVRDGRFALLLPPRAQPFYVLVLVWYGAKTDSARVWCEQTLVEPGDSVHLVMGPGNALQFSGRGAAKFRWEQQLLAGQRRLRDSLPRYDFMEHPVEVLAQGEQRLAYQLRRLEAMRAELGERVFGILKADLVAAQLLSVYDIMRLTTFGFDYHDARIGDRLEVAYRAHYHDLAEDSLGTGAQLASGYYATYRLARLEAEAAYRAYHHLQGERSAFGAIRGLPPGRWRDKLLLTWVFSQLGNLVTDSLLEAALPLVGDPVYHTQLQELRDRLGRGSVVKGLAFPDRQGKVVRLEDLRGKVVLVDMWFTGCSGCITVAEAMPGVEKPFRDSPGVVFLSLSIDRDKARWLKSIDPVKRVNGSYTHYTTPGTVYLYTGGTGQENEFIGRYNTRGSYPQLMLIGKDGKVSRMTPARPDEVGGQQRLIAQIREALKE